MSASVYSYVSHFIKVHIATATALGLLVASASSPVQAAIPRTCPQFLAKYCVYNSSRLIFTAETNPCFAKQRHWTVIYGGQCRFRR
jgi:hypothetical protein